MPFANRIIVTDENHRKSVIGKNAKVVFDSTFGKIVETSETHCIIEVEGEKISVPWKQISKIY